jgi:aspartate-semialdehyde dehydrogenase
VSLSEREIRESNVSDFFNLFEQIGQKSLDDQSEEETKLIDGITKIARNSFYKDKKVKMTGDVEKISLFKGNNINYFHLSIQVHFKKSKGWLNIVTPTVIAIAAYSSSEISVFRSDSGNGFKIAPNESREVILQNITNLILQDFSV